MAYLVVGLIGFYDLMHLDLHHVPQLPFRCSISAMVSVNHIFSALD